ncbi:hypothetical protein PUN28_005529 [Cardiocondyla obscurior]|uniref:Uncharacterized protein n=1 Tax=Cardiocondyla obscurior TaxID=286306 RepID=A0AAW2GH08_9HYME
MLIERDIEKRLGIIVPMSNGYYRDKAKVEQRKVWKRLEGRAGERERYEIRNGKRETFYKSTVMGVVGFGISRLGTSAGEILKDGRRKEKELVLESTPTAGNRREIVGGLRTRGSEGVGE